MKDYVYFIMGEFPRCDVLMVKIGVAKWPERRLAELQTACPGALWIQATIECRSRSEALELERSLHHRFRKHRTGGEWFFQNNSMNPYLRPDASELN